MTTKKAIQQQERELAKLCERRDALAAEVSASTEKAQRATAALADFLEAGDLADTKTRARLEAAAEAADGRAEPLRRALASLTTKIEEAERAIEDARGQAALQARYDEAQSRLSKVQSAMMQRYPKLASEIAEILAEAAAVSKLIEQVNERLPDDADPLPLPESVADERGTPAVEISRKRRSIWIYSQTGNVVDDGTLRSLQNGNGIRSHVTTFAGKDEVELKSFAEVTQRPARAPARADSLAMTVRLPGLGPYAPPIWPAADSEGGEAVETVVVPA